MSSDFIQGNTVFKKKTYRLPGCCRSTTLFFSCRVLTGPKSWAAAQTFVGAEPNSVWDLIYKKQMTDESFSKSETAAIETLLKSNKLFTCYGYVESLIYSSKPCQLKVVWKSPGKNL